MLKDHSRVEYIDLFKGIGILLMIMGHIGVNKQFAHLIYGFHMPMFFFVAGIFYKGGDFKLYFVKILKSLVFSYMFFVVLQYIFWVVFESNIFTLKPLVNCFWINTDSSIPIAKACWFLTALFWCRLLYYLIRKINSNYLITFIIIILAIFGCLEMKILKIQLPLALGSGMVGLGFYHIGYVLYNKQKLKNKILNLRWNYLLLLALLSFTVILKNGLVSMKTAMYSNIILFWIGAVSAIIVGLNLCKSVFANYYRGG